jgi:V/A-type H+-transporting ATPase subunit E
MNGIEKIIQLIQAEAQTEIDAVLEKAREEAAEITARYQHQSETEAADLEYRNKKIASEREERLISVAQMESRKVTLQVKQEMVEKAYELALKKLCSMQDDQYIEVLKQLILKASVSGREEVIFSSEIRETIGKAAVEQANQSSGKNLILSKETRPIPGGFILKDGNIEVNCAFDTLVRLERAETAGTVAKKLFG